MAAMAACCPCSRRSHVRASPSASQAVPGGVACCDASAAGARGLGGVAMEDGRRAARAARRVRGARARASARLLVPCVRALARPFSACTSLLLCERQLDLLFAARRIARARSAPVAA
eukprot:2875914-Pleurochrysis_carterae.AAC.2